MAGVEPRWQDESGSNWGGAGRVAVYGPDETPAEVLNRRLLLHVAVCRDCEADDPKCANGRQLYEQAYQAQRQEQEEQR